MQRVARRWTIRGWSLSTQTEWDRPCSLTSLAQASWYPDGRLLTNHHVAEPWWSNEELKQLLDRGAVAFAASYMAYFPGAPQGIAANLDRISQHADLAILKLSAPAPLHAALLNLDDRSEASVTGDPVVLIGYPTGNEGILA